MFCLGKQALSVEGFAVWAGYGHYGFHLTQYTHTIPLLSQGFGIIYLDDILVLTHSKHDGRKAQTYFCSLLVHLGLHINFSKPELNLMQQFSFLGQYWIQWTFCLSLYCLRNLL